MATSIGRAVAVLAISSRNLRGQTTNLGMPHRTREDKSRGEECLTQPFGMGVEVAVAEQHG